MSKDFMEILRKKPRLMGIKQDPKAIKAVREALEYAASPMGGGLGGRSVYEALVEGGAIEKSYRSFCEYCRVNEKNLWIRVKSR